MRSAPASGGVLTRWSVLGLWAFFPIHLAVGQCAIQPIKPIPPIGCKDVTPQCVTDNNHQSHWTWICVPDTGDSNTRTSGFPKPALTPKSAVVPAQPRPSFQSQDRAAPPYPEAQAVSANESEMSPEEQHSVSQLRAVARSIGNCSEENPPFD